MLKQAAVNDYLNGNYTAPEILKKYKIRSETQLRKWIKKYNGHEELKSFGTGENTIMLLLFVNLLKYHEPLIINGCIEKFLKVTL